MFKPHRRSSRWRPIVREKVNGTVNDSTARACRVLVVDDEPDIRLLLRVVLEEKGYSVVAEAVDGVDALQQFSQHTPDAVVVDLSMPNLGGVEVIRRLRLTASTPMVGYSAAPSREDERALLALGVPLVTKDTASMRSYAYSTR